VRDYELLFIAAASLEQEPLNTLVQQVGDLVTQSGGVVEKGLVMGRRRLAFPIKNQTDGVYVLFWFQADKNVLSAVNRDLRLNENVLRHIVVFRDEKMKAVDAARAARAAEAAAAAEREAAEVAAAASAQGVPVAVEEAVAEFGAEPVLEVEAVAGEEVEAVGAGQPSAEAGTIAQQQPAAEGESQAEGGEAAGGEAEPA